MTPHLCKAAGVKNNETELRGVLRTQWNIYDENVDVPLCSKYVSGTVTV